MENKARLGGWKCGKGSGTTKLKKKFNPYIPTSVPGPPNMSAAVPKKQNKKLGQWNTMQDDDEQKKKALPFSNKLKMIDHMHTHQLTQKQAADYWAENSYRGRVSQKNISIWVKNEDHM